MDQARKKNKNAPHTPNRTPHYTKRLIMSDLLDRSTSLLLSDNIDHSTKARVVFLRSKQVPESTIAKAVARFNAENPQNQYVHEALEEDDGDWGVKVGLFSVGVALGCALVKVSSC